MASGEIIELVKSLWPIIVVQLVLQVYALVDVSQKRKTRNLSVLAWVMIILFGEIFGAIAYLLVGRAED